MTDGLRIEQIAQNLQPQNVEEKRNSKPVSSSKGDQAAGSQALQLSPQAQDVRDAIQTIRNLPDVRQQKIEQLQRQLAQGKVEVIPEILVQKLLERIFPPSA